MALTKGTTTFITPYAQAGVGKSGTILSIPYTSSSAIRKGDVLVLTSGLAVSSDAAQTDGTILGIALEARASAASMDYTNQVPVALALPGALFEGSLCGGAATDYTSNAAAAIVATTQDTVLGTDSYTGYILLNQADTTGGQCRLIQYSPNQMGGKNFTAFGNTTIVNPRVIFCFRSSAFQPLA